MHVYKIVAVARLLRARKIVAPLILDAAQAINVGRRVHAASLTPELFTRSAGCI